MIHALSLEEEGIEEDPDEHASPILPPTATFSERVSESDLNKIDPYSHSVHSNDEEDLEQDEISSSSRAPMHSPPILPTSKLASTSNLDLASSIHAIYRPIAARRRAATGESGECASNGIYLHQEESSASLATRENNSMESLGTHLGVGTLGRSQRSNTVTTLNREEKLADKLEDIFGLDVREDVVAGEYIFRYHPIHC